MKYLTTLLALWLAGCSVSAIEADPTAELVSAAAVDRPIELLPGDTFRKRVAVFHESAIYAPLADGSTYYLFQVAQPGRCCGVDTVILVLANTGAPLYAASLNDVSYSREQMGLMADRIGEMADRIVYTEELIVETEHLIADVIAYSQQNLLSFTALLNPLHVF